MLRHLFCVPVLISGPLFVPAACIKWPGWHRVGFYSGGVRGLQEYFPKCCMGRILFKGYFLHLVQVAFTCCLFVKKEKKKNIPLPSSIAVPTGMKNRHSFPLSPTVSLLAEKKPSAAIMPQHHPTPTAPAGERIWISSTEAGASGRSC